jgi:uncharacterized protein (TIGR00369 family)
MTVAELDAFLAAEFPQIDGMRLRIEAVAENYARVRMPVDASHLRPGGTVSGPTMFALADVGLYVAILGMIGPVALAVTTNLAINFLRKPGLSDMIAEVRLLKLGKRLAVGEVHLYSEGSDAPVAQVTATYSIPPRD